MEASEPRRPGRPRSEPARRAILSATLALAAEEGPRGVSMDAIARRAGVSKDTLYRWWGSKADVLLEALAERGRATIAIPDTGTLVGDLRAFLRATAASGDAATVRVLRALASEAAADADFATVTRERFLSTRRHDLGLLLERAVDRGELDAEDLEMVTDLVYGSLWYRLIFGVGALDDDWAAGVTRVLARASRSGSAAIGDISHGSPEE